MDCPVCKNSQMITLELNQVEIDHCLQCKGIWLDEGELELLLDNPAQANQLLNSFKSLPDSTETKHKCPICRKKMEKISVGENDNKIIIDKCTKNHGIWFDNEELDAILEHAKLDEQNKLRQLLKEMFNKNKGD